MPQDENTSTELERLRSEIKALREAELPNYDLLTVRSLTQLQPDWYLQRLVSLVEDPSMTKHKMSFAVTLLTNGALVSGQLIGAREYFELFDKEWVAALHLPEGKSLFGTFIDEIYPENERPDALERRYIHLKGARMFFGTQQVPSGDEGVLWRGRLAAIAGFTVGDTRATPNP
jgi:hypothetical protein